MIRFRMQVTLTQMKKLFALKDEAAVSNRNSVKTKIAIDFMFFSREITTCLTNFQALMQDLLNNEIEERDVFAACIKFYNDTQNASKHVKFTPEEEPKSKSLY